MLDSLPAFIIATGALGTAAFGIVEGLKGWKFIGEAGFGVILSILGRILDMLTVAYGSDVERLLRGQYRGEQQELAKALRQGARIGLTAANAVDVAKLLGSVEPELLRQAALAVESGEDLPPTLRNVLGKFELAVDARIDAALALAQDRYKRTVQVAASIVALAIAVSVGFILRTYQLAGQVDPVLKAVLVGLAAVPLAPVAKDVASALKAAAEAIRTRT